MADVRFLVSAQHACVNISRVGPFAARPWDDLLGRGSAAKEGASSREGGVDYRRCDRDASFTATLNDANEGSLGFASWTGTAPLDASSGEQIRHRLSRAGGRSS